MRNIWKITKASIIVVLIMCLGISSNGMTNKLEISLIKEEEEYKNKFVISNPISDAQAGEIVPITQPINSFEDEEGNVHYFFSDTGILCGYQKKLYYGFHEENPIGIEEAITIANQYLAEVIPEFNDYTLIFSQHSECDAVYQIQYSYLINEIVTDDLINIFIQENGEVGAFMMPNRGQYSAYDIDEEFIESCNMSESIASQYITLTNKGLMLVQNSIELNETGYEEMVQKTYLIKESK